MSEEFEVIYAVNIKDPAAHLFEITCIVNSPDPDGQEFSLPAWIPGSYMIRDFAKNIIQVRASGGAHPLKIEKLDKQTWRCQATNEESITIIYEVYAWDLSVRTAHMDQSHAYFNGTSLFLRLHGKDHKPHLVDLLPPFQPQLQGWKVATSLTNLNAADWGFGTYTAHNYEDLIDHPVEMGTFQQGGFEACGVRHDVVFTGVCQPDIERICDDLKKVCETQIQFFGEPAPFKRFLFQVMVVGNGYGGLEHRSSTSLLCSRTDLPQLGEEKVTEAYRTFLGLCSHEYFHSWNVKRIKPEIFNPVDLSKEVHTELLWWFEGVTSYYDDLFLARSGLISKESYLELLAQTITRVIRGSGRLKQSVADSSFDAWTKFYKQDENSPNAIVSYYSKGSLIALCLDLTIRQQTKLAKNLDDVMQYVWGEYGLKNRGVPEKGFESIIKDVAGVDVEEFFAKYIYGTEELPLAMLLSEMGVDLKMRAAESQTDFGGKAKAEASLPKVQLGAATSRGENGLTINSVFEGGSAHLGGLSAGDVIVAVNRLRVGADNFDKMINRYKPGEQISITAFRRDELREFNCTLQEAEKNTCYLELIEKAPKAVIADWLG